MLTPSCAALNPAASATTPPRTIARSIPVPARAAVAPRDEYRPVPMIMAALRRVAVPRPRLRDKPRLDRASAAGRRRRAAPAASEPGGKGIARGDRGGQRSYADADLLVPDQCDVARVSG